MPENTIPAFLKALELGVRTLELDVVMNGDGELVVSHEPWIDDKICLTIDGQPVAGKKKTNIYTMSQHEIERYDCGSLALEGFPAQKKLPVSKPLLSEVFTKVSEESNLRLNSITWNIEIKYRPSWEGVFCPDRKTYLKIFRKIIEDNGLEENTILQCFDAELLRIARQMNFSCELSYLIYNKKGIERNIKELGFEPDYYSPYFKRLKISGLNYAQNHGIKVAVWTVNEIDDLKEMLRLGVDAIITDYPNRLIDMRSRSE